MWEANNGNRKKFAPVAPGTLTVRKGLEYEARLVFTAFYSLHSRTERGLFGIELPHKILSQTGTRGHR
jgi:hypothetical protein